MATADAVLTIARSQLGTKESPANSNKTKYGAWYGADRQPWCAQFVSWCFAQAGSPLHITTDKGYAYCPYGVAYFQKAKRWTTTPQVGAIVFYGSPSESVHTGIVESFDATTITAIEGNTAVGNDANGGEVMRRVRPRNNWIIGYGLPQYDTQKVLPMYNPPVHLDSDVVATMKDPQTGGFWQLTSSGAVYAWEGAPYLGAANNKPYFVNRKAARLEIPNVTEQLAGKRYVVIATSGERYAY